MKFNDLLFILVLIKWGFEMVQIWVCTKFKEKYLSFIQVVPFFWMTDDKKFFALNH